MHECFWFKILLLKQICSSILPWLPEDIPWGTSALLGHYQPETEKKETGFTISGQNQDLIHADDIKGKPHKHYMQTNVAGFH